jgi:hypothetical protein
MDVGDTRQIMIVCFKDDSWSLLIQNDQDLWYVRTMGLGHSINNKPPLGKDEGKDL